MYFFFMKFLLKIMFLGIFSIIYGQVWIDATPEMLHSKEFIHENNFGNQNIIRPFLLDNNKNFYLGARTEFYFNNNFHV